MKTEYDVIFLTVFLLSATKDLACGWGLVNQVRGGGSISERLDSGEAGQSDLDDYVAQSNPFDHAFDTMRSGFLATVLNCLFRSWFTVTIGAVTIFALGGRAEGLLVLLLGITTSLNAVMHLVTAVIRRLILGHHDSRAKDVQMAAGLTKRWAVGRDPLGNLSVYFLVLVYFAIIGFAALDRSLAADNAQAFAFGHLAPSFVLWMYLSITTIATVGFGDVHAISVGAQIAVICQIATGPLLLSWLIAVFATQPQRHGSA